MMKRRLFLGIMGGVLTLPMFPALLGAEEPQGSPERVLKRYQEAYLYPYGELVVDIAAEKPSIASEAALLGFAKSERLMAELGVFLSGKGGAYSENSSVLKRLRGMLAAEAVFLSEIPGLSHPVLTAWKTNGLAIENLGQMPGIRELSAAFIVDEVSRTLTGCGAKQHLVLGFNFVRARGLDEYGGKWPVAIKALSGRHVYFRQVGVHDLSLASSIKAQPVGDLIMPLGWGNVDDDVLIHAIPAGCEPDAVWAGGRSAVRAGVLAQAMPALRGSQRMIDFAEEHKMPLHVVTNGEAAGSSGFPV